jgi:hypothetical protein
MEIRRISYIRADMLSQGGVGELEYPVCFQRSKKVDCGEKKSPENAMKPVLNPNA